MVLGGDLTAYSTPGRATSVTGALAVQRMLSVSKRRPLSPRQQPLAAAKVLPALDERGQPVETPLDCVVAECSGHQSIDPVRLSASGIQFGPITLRVGGKCGGATSCRLLAHQSLEQIPVSRDE